MSMNTHHRFYIRFNRPYGLGRQKQNCVHQLFDMPLPFSKCLKRWLQDDICRVVHLSLNIIKMRRLQDTQWSRGFLKGDMKKREDRYFAYFHWFDKIKKTAQSYCDYRARKRAEMEKELSNTVTSNLSTSSEPSSNVDFWKSNVSKAKPFAK
nr:uncharacterized protein LOC118683856 [Bactrocera oleae]